MRNRDNIQHLLEHLQTTEEKELQFNKEAIIAAYQKSRYHQSLTIKILSVLGGILASLAFLGFLFIAGLYNSSTGQLILGTICIAGAIGINRKYDKILMDTLSVSFFIIGFILLGFGLGKLQMTGSTISIAFILIAIFTLCVVQNYMLSFVSVLIMNGSILTLIILNKAYDLIHIYVAAFALFITYLFLKEARIITAGKALSRLYDPVKTGVILSFLAGLICLGKRGILPVSPDYIWLSSVIIIATIIYWEFTLFRLLNTTKSSQKIIICIFTALTLLPTVLSPAIPGALLIILLSFLVNYKTGLVLGIMAFIYFISQYYYDLNFTLLTKSLLLFSSGIFFTALYLFTHKKLAANEKI
ncbi:MAG TPA: DUF4401 domain-containing protein [Niabella sp.]|nr:DUF4401 domain-containing protein [Niabella sp.]